MSSNESMTPATDLTADQAITIQPTNVATYAGANDWLPPGESDPSDGGLGATAFLHAMRRHWLLIVATGVAAAAVTGVALLFLLKPKYEASATLMCALVDPKIMHNSVDEQSGQNEFEIFMGNQLGLIKARFVLTAALRDPKLKSLSCIQREDARHNALAWLASEVQVQPKQKGTGLIDVACTLPDPNEAAAVVNAVVNAYMEEVVNKDRLRRRQRFDSLQGISVIKEEELRVKRDHLAQSGGQQKDDQMTLLHLQQTAASSVEFQRELQKMKWDRMALQAKLQDVTSTLQTVATLEIPDIDVTALLNNDPDYREILPRVRYMKLIRDDLRKRMVTGSKPTSNQAKTEAQLNADEKALQDMKEDAREKIRASKRIEMEKEKRQLDNQVEIATQQINEFEKQVNEKRHEADELGKSTTMQQTEKADIDNLERLLRGIAEERERLRVELDAQSANSPMRVQVLGDPTSPADKPETEANPTMRYILVGGASLVSLCVPGLGILIWDLRKRRINTPSEVSKNLKLGVMGSLPFIPPTIMRRLGNLSARSQLWKLRYTEAVDGVAARLLRNAESDDARVVLVTSAMGGEGKTWLATQLAMALARAQRRTLLVDFDLRQPALDGALGLPLAPGVCEALRGQGDITQMVQPTETEFLSVVTAGSWNRQVLPTLAGGTVAAMLEQLRENFDFVILDSSPLLPVVDSRLVCQHVDSVLLSVLRDISEAGKVEAAQEMLEAFGVARVDAVVTGGEHYGDAKSLRYQLALGAEPSPAQLTGAASTAADGAAPRHDATLDR